MRPFAALFTAFALLLPAQPQQPSVKISVTTSLVIVNVDVRDHEGKAIENLKPEDFTVTEDGKPQKVSVFEYQRLETDALPPLEPAPAPKIVKPAVPAGAAAQPEKVEKVEPKRAITPSPAGQIRYKDRRLMVLFFDFSSMPQDDQLRAQGSALKFLDTQITPADVVSIMAFTNTLQVLQDFTNDRQQLRDIIKSFKIGEASELAAEGTTGDETTGEDTGDSFVADETEFNVFNTDRKLSALESAARMLASLPEKKALVYFSSGVGQTGMENQSQLRATINAAVRANVAFYPIDARGLMASAPAGNASTGAQRGTGVYSGASQQSSRQRVTSQQETLFTLAGDTGGKALLDNNDLTTGIRQAQKDIASYYILGYYSANAAMDGRFRRIKVNLRNHQQAKLDYRSGYFASKQFRNFNTTDKERQLEEALLLGDPVTDLPMALEVNWFRINRTTYFVPVALKIPGSAMELAKRSASEQAELDFVAQVRDSRDRVVGGVRDGITVKLKGDQAGGLATRNLEYDSGFTLPPGKYTLKMVARENVTGKMGTFETKFAVPDMEADSPYLRISSVVWSNQRQAMSAAVASAERNKKLMAMHPLIHDGQKLIPSVTRVYRKDQNLYVYLEAYDAATAPGGNSADVTATVSFYRNGQKAFETTVLRAEATAGVRSHTVPLQFSVPLATLKTGKYVCQVNVIDEVGRKFAFSRANMILLGAEARPAAVPAAAAAPKPTGTE